MAKKNVGVRIPLETIERVEAFRVQLQREPGWSGATWADAARVLIDRGLAEVEIQKKRGR